jgi:CheY-like chemotaxis protein
MSQPTRPPLVLLIEDSEDDAFFFRWTLRKAAVACEVIHLADGGAAVRHLNVVASGAAARPDLVFLDLKLPTQSGFEILTWLQGQPALVDLRVIVLSGSEHAGDVSRAEVLGASGYLVKPVSVEQLRDALTQTPARVAGAECPSSP